MPDEAQSPVKHLKKKIIILSNKYNSASEEVLLISV